MPNILCGDALSVLQTLPDSSFQAVVTSPPYFQLRDYGHGEQIGLEASPAAYVDRLVDVFREVRRVLREDGTLWLNLGDSYGGKARNTRGDGAGGGKARGDMIFATTSGRDRGGRNKDLLGIPWRVAFALQDDGWILRSAIVWHKPNPMPESVKDRPTNAYEHVFLFAKQQRYYYDQDAIKEKATGLPSGRPSQAKMDARQAVISGGGEGGFRNGYPGSEYRNARNVWKFTPQPFKGSHFAAMPVALAERCIIAGSKHNDVILDPFGGAGTTGLAAKNSGRDFTLIELNPDYVELAKQRLGLIEETLP